MNTGTRVKLLFSQLQERLDNKDMETFDAVSDRVHSISDKEGLTTEEYEIWDDLRDKANKIQVDNYFKNMT